ncbi:hypothetical protein [Commensalibacter oyaizuii]|uniref:Uncharacterized protein n=1 Tax=Commensalibacter oyaizuii TaxID=3043873 RepID=A0ABT6Q089_9PROT|nr:hypothetical protein [Commensalibacter sp. TBRC 16381]MDI2090518.1 hypothetical protein [Commensalibacter sp. TBRC 16381]
MSVQDHQKGEYKLTAISAPRLYGILARDARVGVILRRGPNQWVQLVRWDLRNDTLEHGQWLKGRVYEKRCDLSPSGEYLIYFISRMDSKGYCGTMVSKPPFFTALAYWKHGDNTWGGGGVFDDENCIRLNHLADEQELADGFSVPSYMRIKLFGENSGRGEDGYVYHHTQCRDGWVLIQEGKGHYASAEKGCSWYYDPVRIFEKTNKYGFKLQQIWRWTARKNRPFQEFDYCILDSNNQICLQLHNLTWADWDQGDLVFAENGCLYRLSCEKEGYFPAIEKQFFKLIYNFRKNSFIPLTPPPQACKW